VKGAVCDDGSGEAALRTPREVLRFARDDYVKQREEQKPARGRRYIARLEFHCEIYDRADCYTCGAFG
jgi:hypothetical protein